MKEVVIVGGGASGLFAAIALKKMVGNNANITIVERLERVGKKVLATGSGKANFSNSQLKSTNYNHPHFVSKLYKEFGYKETVKFFNELGLLTIVNSEGRAYPKSESSSSLLDVMRNQIRSLGIEEKCNFDVKKISKAKGQYVIENTRGIRLNADYVIVAAGGTSTRVLGSNGTGYTILKNLKVKITSVEPGLVGIKTDEQSVKGLEGIRSKAKVRLYVKKNKEPVWENEGEIQFKIGGMSGIVIMEMASHISRMNVIGEQHASHFTVDFYPEFSNDELTKLLNNRQKELNDYTNANFLIGMFHKKLAGIILKKAKVDVAGYVKDMTTKDIDRIVKVIKECQFLIKGLDSFDKSQVTVGGVDIKEIVHETMEIRKLANLYVCGEIIDVDGDCGGFNLQWAWTSAYTAAKAIAKKISAESIEYYDR